MGYDVHPVVRQVPLNGAEVTTDFRTRFTDANGQTRSNIRYVPDLDTREDVNRVSRTVHNGFRVQVDLTLEIVTAADHEQLAELVDRMAREDWTSFLSIDGGTTENQVELVDYRGPDALGGKTVAGARFRLRMRSKDLVPEIPVLS